MLVIVVIYGEKINSSTDIENITENALKLNGTEGMRFGIELNLK